MNQDYSIASPDELLPVLSPGLVVEEDVPGQRLKLAWRGAPPNARWRILAFVALLLGTVIWLTAVYFVTQPLWVLPPFNEEYIIAGLVFGFGLYFLYTLLSVAGKGFAYWHEYTWDAVEDTFLARQRGWLVWGHKSEGAPLKHIRTLWLELGPEEEPPLATTLRQYYDDDWGEFWTTMQLTPLRFSRRSEAIEMFFALARVLKADGYYSFTNNPEEQKLIAWPKTPDFEQLQQGDANANATQDDSEEDEDDEEEEDDFDTDLALDVDPEAIDPRRIAPIPGAGELPAELLAPPPAERRRHDLPRFDPDALREKIATWRVETWDPGVTVHFSRPAEPTGLAVAAGVFGAIGGGLAGWFPLWGVAHLFLPLTPPERWILVLVGAVLGALLLAFAVWNNTRAQDVLIDCRQKLVSWRNGNRVQDFPQGAVRSLTLTQLRRETPEGESSTTPRGTQYAYHLHLNAGRTKIPLLKAEVWERDPAAMRQILEPLAGELADTLGVDCLSRSSSETTPHLRETFRLTWGQGLVMGVIVAALAGWLGVRGVQEARAQLAARELRALGVHCHRMGSYRRNDYLIGENYWEIEIKDRTLLQQDPERLRSLLAKLPDIGLDVRESNCIDGDLEPFRGLVPLRIAQIEMTALGDASVDALADCPNLHYLDASGCRLSDASAAALSKLKRLHFLYLPGTQITDDGLTHLAQLQSLRVLHLGGTRTTPQGLQALRKALPRTTSINP